MVWEHTLRFSFYVVRFFLVIDDDNNAACKNHKQRASMTLMRTLVHLKGTGKNTQTTGRATTRADNGQEVIIDRILCCNIGTAILYRTYQVICPQPTPRMATPT